MSCSDKRYEHAPREAGGGEGSTVPAGIDERSERALREVGGYSAGKVAPRSQLLLLILQITDSG